MQLVAVKRLMIAESSTNMRYENAVSQSLASFEVQIAADRPFPAGHSDAPGSILAAFGDVLPVDSANWDHTPTNFPYHLTL